MMGFDLDGTTWWKRDGSDHFTIRNVVFFGNEMEIQTTDGRMLHGDAIQEYIQSEEPINVFPAETHINKANLLQGMSKEELGDIFVQDIPTNTPAVGDNLSKPVHTPISQESENDIIIKRLIDKLGKPEFELDFKLKESDEYVGKLKNMADVMDLSLEEIRDYICRGLDMDGLHEFIVQSFIESFNKKFMINPSAEEPPVEEPPIVSEPEKKSKKTKKDL